MIKEIVFKYLNLKKVPAQIKRNKSFEFNRNAIEYIVICFRKFITKNCLSEFV